MRIVTAREQVEMLSPWRQAEWTLKPWQSTEIDYEAPDLTQVADIPEHGGRWSFPHKSKSDRGYHDWGVHPTDAPATHEYDYHGELRQLHYNPELTGVDVDPDFNRAFGSNRGNHINDIHPDKSTPGIIWRGMSHEEMENAKKNGYFKSNGSYNFTGQEDKTLFDEKASTAESYASYYAPFQHQPTFSRPGHVIGIPDEGHPRNSVGEVEVPGRIPLNSVTHHYRGDVISIDPGSFGGYQGHPNLDYGFNGFDEQPSRRKSPSSTIQWSLGELHRGDAQ